MFRLDTERAVLVAHTLKLGDQLADVVDVGGEAEDDRGQGTRLPAILLVDTVEVVVQLRVVAKHVLVEDGRDLLTVLSEGRDGVLDQF